MDFLKLIMVGQYFLLFDRDLNNNFLLMLLLVPLLLLAKLSRSVVLRSLLLKPVCDSAYPIPAVDQAVDPVAK